MPPEQQFILPNQMPVNPVPQAQVPQIGYAGFWLRFLALSLDHLIITVISIPIGVIRYVVGSRNPFFAVVMVLLQIALMFGYFIFLTNKNQATIGKKLLGLRVVSEDGTSVSLGRIILRETIGRFVSMLILGIGYFMVAFTSKKQGLHDKIAGSVVISNPAERKTWALVISIIIASLLPAIAIVGILASVVLASLNVAREKGTDALVKTSLMSVRAQAEIDYNANNKSYGTIFADPVITEALKTAATAVKSNPTGNTSDAAYVIYLPLKRPTAPNTGWCVDSTGTSRESVNPGTATVCP